MLNWIPEKPANRSELEALHLGAQDECLTIKPSITVYSLHVWVLEPGVHCTQRTIGTSSPFQDLLRTRPMLLCHDRRQQRSGDHTCTREAFGRYHLRYSELDRFRFQDTVCQQCLSASRECQHLPIMPAKAVGSEKARCSTIESFSRSSHSLVISASLLILTAVRNWS